MRSISLKDIVSGKVDDDAILLGLESSHGLPKAIRAKVTAAYAEYRKKRGSNLTSALNLLDPWPKRFSGLYEGRAKVHGLDWIEQIATTPRYGYCPMCGAETHKTVEHMLPRKPWSEFSILSHNLVPSCATCNNKRGNRANAPGTSPRLLHPYFDGALLRKRLHVTRIKGPYDAPEFEPGVCTALTPKLTARVRHHLEHSVDATVYHQFCNNRWSELKQQVRSLNTKPALNKHLRNLVGDSISSGGPNSWKTAFYAGVLSSPAIANWLFLNRKSF